MCASHEGKRSARKCEIWIKNGSQNKTASTSRRIPEKRDGSVGGDLKRKRRWRLTSGDGAGKRRRKEFSEAMGHRGLNGNQGLGEDVF